MISHGNSLSEPAGEKLMPQEKQEYNTTSEVVTPFGCIFRESAITSSWDIVVTWSVKLFSNNTYKADVHLESR